MAHQGQAQQATNGARPGSWQARLEEHCRNGNLHGPAFSIVSDRRGGRTAWSATVCVDGQYYPARYWYDGRYVDNAKEDSAEVCLQRLGVTPMPQSPQQSHAGQAQWQGVMNG